MLGLQAGVDGILLDGQKSPWNGSPSFPALRAIHSQWRQSISTPALWDISLSTVESVMGMQPAVNSRSQWWEAEVRRRTDGIYMGNEHTLRNNVAISSTATTKEPRRANKNPSCKER